MLIIFGLKVICSSVWCSPCCLFTIVSTGIGGKRIIDWFEKADISRTLMPHEHETNALQI
jgi:hypothetical protein